MIFNFLFMLSSFLFVFELSRRTNIGIMRHIHKSLWQEFRKAFVPVSRLIYKIILIRLQFGWRITYSPQIHKKCCYRNRRIPMLLLFWCHSWPTQNFFFFLSFCQPLLMQYFFLSFPSNISTRKCFQGLWLFDRSRSWSCQ